MNYARKFSDMSYRSETLTKQVSYQVNEAVLREVRQEHVLIWADNFGTANNVVFDTFAMPAAITSHHIVGFGSIATSDMMSVTYVPKAVQESNRFKELLENWRAARNPLSSSAWDNVNIPAYQQMIGMGPGALPFIFAELQKELSRGEPDDWFTALWAITGVYPISPGSRGKIRKMAEAWIKWGLQAGYVNGETVGVCIPVLRAIHRS